MYSWSSTGILHKKDSAGTEGKGKEHYHKRYGWKVIRSPERISVLPQGYGIYLSHIEDHPEDFKKNILTLDIGYNTLDALFLSQGILHLW